ncbi:hypothetical protein [Mesorhizobium sp. NPDC059025]|uniref:hypothetical protein n=1 Tax=unclassified Mesorhizobium TaxID=325217 RepID=UPI003690FA3E
MVHHVIPIHDGKRPTPIGPEPGKVYFFGTAREGDVVAVPPEYGNTSDYFMMISVPVAGIPGDSHFADNGFSGFSGGYSTTPDSWTFNVASADNLEAGATGGMGAVTTRTVKLELNYAAIRK